MHKLYKNGVYAPGVFPVQTEQLCFENISNAET
jgi:hypothetical protein